jgi:tRNA(fMet)-specific endonuclease VapC
MIYILDTVSLGMFEQRHPATLRRMHEVIAEGGNQVVTTIVTVEEKMDGWLLECRKAQTGQARLRALAELSGAVDLWLQHKWLPFSHDAAVLFDQHIRLKKLIGARDLSIAVIALSVGGIVVTRNFADFSRVPNLKYEDWAIERPLK